MQFLVMTQRYTDRFAEAEFAAVIPEETEAVRRLYADGVVRQIWLRDDVRGAALIVEANSLEAARAVVDALPLAQRAMSSFTVIALKPYGGFGPT